MMKKVLKLLKIYLIWDAICWMLVGCSHVFDKYRRNPDLTIMECIDEITDETYHRFTGKDVAWNWEVKDLD